MGSSPYLLTIRGSTQIKTLLNPQKEISIGSCTRSPCDLILNHPSVLAKHCIIGYVRTGDDKDKTNNNTSEEDDDSSSRKLYSSGSDSANCSRGGDNVGKTTKENFCKNEVWLRRAMAGAMLSVNNKVINDKQIWTILSSGDILTIGQEFTCILVDPAKNEDGFNLQGRISQAMKYALVSEILKHFVLEYRKIKFFDISTHFKQNSKNAPFYVTTDSEYNFSSYIFYFTPNIDFSQTSTILSPT